MADSIPPQASASPMLQISTDDGETGTSLIVSGELDIASAPTLQRAIEERDLAGGRPLLIDLSNLSFMDSTGLRALVVARQHAADNGYELVLRQGPRQVQRVFELSGTLDRFRFED